MTGFTLAYLGRLASWAAGLASLQGLLVLGAWLAWARVLAHATPAARHRLAAAHFAALALLPLLTLAILQWTVAGMGPSTPRESPTGELVALAVGHRGLVGGVLAVAWLAGAAAMLARLAQEVRGLARLRREAAPAAAVDELRRLARGAVVPRLQVAEVSSPQVVGWRRPVLLVPPDLAERLPAPEREAVLLHELAHVYRRDFGWNLLQRVVLSLLWFHPVAWRLQAGVARERERCCDALAVRHGASPAALARALVKLAESAMRARTSPVPRLALAVSGGDGLLERVGALIGPEVPSDPLPARRRLAVALLASAACVLALAAGRGASVDPSLGDFYMASAFGPTLAIQAHDAAGPFALRVRQGRVLWASMRDQPVGIRQEGSRVTLTDAAQAPLLVLTVTPQGRVQWQARR